MDRLKFYQKIYYKELERKNELENSLTLPVGLITIICTALFYLTTNFNYQGSTWITITFIIFVFISISCLAVTIYQLIRAYNNFTLGYEYHYLSYGSEIEKYYAELIEYYKKKKSNYRNKLNVEAEKEFDDYLISEFIDKADKNIYNNDKKQSHLYKARISLIFSLISILLLVIPFGVNYFKHRNNTLKIEVINPLKVIK